MFEDIIGSKRIVTKPLEFYDVKKQCPHCKRPNIVKRPIHNFTVGGGRNKQPAYCAKCKKLWYIVYDRATKSAYIQHIKGKKNV